MTTEQSPITPEEFARRMREIDEMQERFRDAENRHIEADELLTQTLRSLGYAEGCDVFDNMGKWYA